MGLTPGWGTNIPHAALPKNKKLKKKNCEEISIKRKKNKLSLEYFKLRLPRWCSSKESTCQHRRHKRHGFDPWIRKIPWRRAWQSTLVFLPGESHGQSILVPHSSWGHKELDTTEQSPLYFSDKMFSLLHRDLEGLTSVILMKMQWPSQKKFL